MGRNRNVPRLTRRRQPSERPKETAGHIALRSRRSGLVRADALSERGAVVHRRADVRQNGAAAVGRGAGGVERLPGLLSGGAPGRLSLCAPVAEVAWSAAASRAAPGAAGPGVRRPADPRGKVGCRRPRRSRPPGCGCCWRFPWACRFWPCRPARRCSRRGSPRRAEPAGRDPYFLYAASNLGSLLALLAYPLVIEAQATLARQSAAGRSATDCSWP